MAPSRLRLPLATDDGAAYTALCRFRSPTGDEAPVLRLLSVPEPLTVSITPATADEAGVLTVTVKDGHRKPAAPVEVVIRLVTAGGATVELPVQIAP